VEFFGIWKTNIGAGEAVNFAKTYFSVFNVGQLQLTPLSIVILKLNNF
jgi:hypothetical protein